MPESVRRERISSPGLDLALETAMTSSSEGRSSNELNVDDDNLSQCARDSDGARVRRMFPKNNGANVSIESRRMSPH